MQEPVNIEPSTEEELAKLATHHSEEKGWYFLPNGLIVKWNEDRMQEVGYWDPLP